MRITSVGAARPAYYDRNATTSPQTYNATVGPHASTVRWTYTVPSGRRAFIEGSSVSTCRITAAAPAGQVNATVERRVSATSYTVNGVVNQNNVVGQADRQAIAGGITAIAADIVRGSTADLGTGGTVLYDVNANVVEYDA